MTKEIEVEFIGDISDKKYKELQIKFGKPIKTKKRISFMYFREKIPEDFSQVQDDGLDLRLRITNGKPELIAKQGLFTASHSRKETSIYFESSEIQKYVDLLVILGWKYVVAYAAETSVYEYQGIEFSLIKIKDYGYNFEAEIMTESENIEKVKNQITEQLKVLGLKPFDDAGLSKQCNTINGKKDLQFDFSKDDFEKIKQRFADFF